MAVPLSRLEARIAALFGYGDAVLFGRARSAVAALLEVLGGSGPFVMPSNLCPDLWLAVHRSAAGPVVLVDVDAHTGLPPDEAFVAAMARQPRAGVVMPAHLYGLVQDYPKTIAYARAHGWFILENDTVATKAVAGFSAFGDALLVSFGAAKAIEAGGGGAIACRDPALAAALRARAASYPVLDRAAHDAEAEYGLLARRLRQGGGGGGAREAALLAQSPAARFHFPDQLAGALADALDSWPRVLDARRRRVQKWRRSLAPYSAALLAPALPCAFPWRLTLRAPGRRDQLVRSLRQAGIDAGTNFPPLTDSFPVLLAGQVQPGGQQWGREVLNLWLTAAYDDARIGQAAEVIGAALEQAP